MGENKLDISLKCGKLNMEISQPRRVLLGNDWKYDGVLSRFSRIYFPISGEGLLTTETESVRLLPGKIYVIPSMLRFSYSCDGRLEKIYSHIHTRLPSGFDAFSEVGRILRVEDRGECLSLLSYADGGETEGAIYAGAVISSALVRVAAENDVRLRAPEKYGELVSAAIDCVSERLSIKLRISDVAAALYTSRQVLQREFLREVGISIGRYIDERVMTECERRLVAGESIDTISEALGFCDRFYLTRRFSESYGVSPDKYRRINGFQRRSN